MRSSQSWGLWFCVGMVITQLLLPELVFAYGFENKMKGLTDQLIYTVLPLLSVLGLVFAAILAMTGDGAAKMKVLTVIAMSVIGFLAPAIIRWLQSATGS